METRAFKLVRQAASARSTRTTAGTSTLDLALKILEFLAQSSHPLPLGAIAARFSASKPTVYRHLRSLLERGFVQQDPVSGRYEPGIKLVVIGEAARNRFNVVGAARDDLIAVRDATRQAVTICTLVQDEVVVLDLLQGRSVIEFGIRPGTRLDLRNSAHGKIWMAFGPPHLASMAERLPTPPGRSAGNLSKELSTIRSRGWSTSPNQVVNGVNAMAAPIFDFSNALVGSIAIVGSTQFIPDEPSREQVDAILNASRRISQRLGWRKEK